MTIGEPNLDSESRQISKLRGRRANWRSGLFLLVVLVLFRAPTANSSTNSPLYLLTYDHGGVILWGPEHFAERLRNGISWLDRYPGFRMGLDNEAYLYDYLAEQEPDLLEELRGYLKKYAGRFGIGTCTYGQPLSSFINEESNIRQIGYAIKADQTHLGYTPIIYLMSEHAMHSQMPQILNGFGFKGAIMRTHFMMYGYNPTFDVPIGWWSGLDGSQIPTVPTYPGEGAEFFKTTVDNWFLTRYPGPEATKSPEDFHNQFAHIRPLLATRADDAGLRKEALVRQYAGNPDYQWVLLDQLPGILPKPEAVMKTAPNDFKVRMPWGYCGNRIWNGCRRAEVEILTAERLAATELMLGGSGHEDELEQGWKNLLVAQHHDVQICGLISDARKYLGASLGASSNIISRSMRYAASRMSGGGLAQVTVYNPLSWSRREWLETEVDLPKADAKALVVRHDGQEAPSVVLTAERSSGGNLRSARIAFLADVPSLSLVSYSIWPSTETGSQPAANIEVDSKALAISTPFIEAHLEPHGGIASLRDKRSGLWLFAPGKRSAFFAGCIDGKECESQGRWTLHPADDQVPWVTAREDGFIGDIPYTLEIRFRADSMQLDCRASFHVEGQKIGQVSNDTRDRVSPFAHEHKLRFKVFPELKANVIGIRDLPFAVSETTNHYVEGIYWAAVSDGDKGVAFFNRGTMGSVREDDGGFSLPLAHAMYYIWGTRMLNGDYDYEFAVNPFTSEWHQTDLHRKAIAYNFPLVSLSSTHGTGELGGIVQPFEAGSDHILLSAFYPENGRLYARFYESAGSSGEVSIVSKDGRTRLRETDLCGRPGQVVASPLRFNPWQFRTFRLEPQPKQAR